MSDSPSSIDRLLRPPAPGDSAVKSAEGHSPTPDQIAETVPADGLPSGFGGMLPYHRDFPWQTILAPPQRENSLGRLEHYEILGVVGQGGMGCVLRAFDDQLHRIVAVKLMLAKLISSENAGRRFIREARAAASINHPNVVTVHAVAEHQGMPYLVMEFVDGRTLHQRIQEDAPLELLDVLRIGEQICNGLAAAHKQGIVHRDIKPGNIILEDGVERVKITDFGLARLVLDHSDLTSLGDMVGTPAFMSPEQVGGGEIDTRSDLFSLGSVIYAMIAGNSPFRKNTTIGSANAVKNEPHQPLREVAPDTPEFLVEIVDRLLQKNPQDRIQTADEVGERLRRQAAVIHHRRIGNPELVESLPLRNSRWRWGALVAVPLLIALLSVGPGWLDDQETPSPPAPPGAGADDTAPVVTPPVEPAEPRQPRSWTVATSGPADFSDLQAAIDAAGPGDLIQVLDAAEYHGPFVIDDAERLAGIKLNSVQSAVLTGPPSQPVVTVATPAVDMQGFRIRCNPSTAGLLVRGAVAGSMLHRLTLEQPEDSDAAAILITDGCRGEPGDGRLIVRYCTFRSVHRSIEVRSTGTDEAAAIAHVLIDGNYFTGSATHLRLQGAVRDLWFDNNVLFGGRGIEVDLQGPAAGGISVCQNTFYRMDSWLHFVDQARNYTGIACNNLILETSDESPLANLREWKTPWEMHHNVWERSTPLSAAIPSGLITIVEDADVPQRVPDTPTFLKPASGGLAATSSSAASYLGAMAPVSGPP